MGWGWAGIGQAQSTNHQAGGVCGRGRGGGKEPKCSPQLPLHPTCTRPQNNNTHTPALPPKWPVIVKNVKVFEGREEGERKMVCRHDN